MQHIENYYALDRKRRERFQRKYCLHPDAPIGCSKNFGAAHTIHKALIKKFLAEKQHVCQLSIDINPKNGNCSIQPELIGINKATTFYGYCAVHDNALFRSLETREFSFDEMQIALLGFRAFSREFYCKHAELDCNTMLIEHMMENPEMRIEDLPESILGKRVGLQNGRRILLDAWQTYSRIVTTASSDDLHYYAILFESAPVYFATVGFLPEWDFNGKVLQDIGCIEVFKGITFSSWAAGNNAAAVFSWHKSWDSICIPFIDSLRSIEENKLANRLLAMAFEVSENVVFKPSWWDSLSDQDKALLHTRASSGMLSDDKNSTCLADYGLAAIEDKVKSVVTNI